MAFVPVAFVLLLLVLAPLAVGIILIVRSGRRARAFPSCGKCRYDVTGTAGTTNRCPECGASYLEVGIIPAGRARGALAGGIVLIVVALSCVGGSMGSYLLAWQAQRQARTAAVRTQALAAQALRQAMVADMAIMLEELRADPRANADAIRALEEQLAALNGAADGTAETTTTPDD